MAWAHSPQLTTQEKSPSQQTPAQASSSAAQTHCPRHPPQANAGMKCFSMTAWRASGQPYQQQVSGLDCFSARDPYWRVYLLRWACSSSVSNRMLYWVGRCWIEGHWVWDCSCGAIAWDCCRLGFLGEVEPLLVQNHRRPLGRLQQWYFDLQMENYRIESKKGEGTYSIVYNAVHKQTGDRIALKVMKQPYENIAKIKKDKEIKALCTCSHPNIIKLLDVLYDEQQQKMGLAFQLMDSNLYEYYKSKKGNGGISIDRVRTIVHDILSAVSYLHKKSIFHRDIKPENVLIKGEKTVKLADLGSCKSILSERPFTEYISTRWYRAPQCLMTDGYYSEKMDVWSVGCILFELIALFPLFPGKSEADQIRTIFNVMGTPKKTKLQKFERRASHMKFSFEESPGLGLQALLEGAPNQIFDLLYKMLEIDPEQRITIEEALQHPFFHSLTELKKYQSKVISRLLEQKEVVLPPIRGKKG